MDGKPYVFCAMPRSGHSAWYNAAISHALAVMSSARVALHAGAVSILTHNFNAMWAECLNGRRENGFTHFAMLHSDVAPLPLGGPWLDTLLAEQEGYGADLLSVIVPIKNPRGLTSTALETDNPWIAQRLTLHEIFERDVTFTEPGLLVNTGCWIVRLGDWCEQLYFRQTDRLLRNREGKLVAATIPEDWDFSRQVKAAGKSVWATRKIPVMHELELWHTQHPWGDWKRDEDYFSRLPIAA